MVSQVGASFAFGIKDVIAELSAFVGSYVPATADLVSIGIAVVGVTLAYMAVKLAFFLAIAGSYRAYYALRSCFKASVERVDFSRTVLDSQVYQVAMAKPAEVAAMAHSASRVQEAQPFKEPVDVILTRVKYDENGPYYPTTIDNVRCKIRVSIPLSTLPSPPTETGGKEAALPTSSIPVPAEQPIWQVQVVVGDQVIGFGIRVRADTLLLTRHEYEILVGQPEIYIQRKEKKIKIEANTPIGKFPQSSDLFAIRVKSADFGALGVKVAPIGFGIAGPIQIYGNNEVMQPCVSFGRLSRGEAKGIFEHNCWTRKGTSGAAVVQGNRVIAIHTGAETNLSANLATTLRYLPVYLGETVNVGKLQESYFDDKAYDRDDERQEMMDKIHSFEMEMRRNKRFEDAEFWDEIWSDVAGGYYGDQLMAKDELNERLDRLKADEATRADIHAYYHTQSGRGISKKKAKYIESDIKGARSSPSTLTSGLRAPNRPSSTESDSSTLGTPPQSAPPPSLLRLQSLGARARSDRRGRLNDLETTQSAKPSSSGSPQGELKPSSSASDTNQQGLYRPAVAAAMASRKHKKPQPSSTR